MGNASALKCWMVLGNVERALAIELLSGTQGVEFLAPLTPGRGVQATHDAVRSLSARVVEDRSLGRDIERVASEIRSGAVVDAVEAEVGAFV